MAPKMIDGTASTKSYMVVAQKGKFVLALRPYPMMVKKQGGKYVSLASFRFRVAPIEVESSRVVALGPQDIAKVFENLPHEKLNAERKSAQFTVPVDVDPESPDKLEEYYQHIIDSVFKAIEDIGGEDVLIDKEQLTEFLSEHMDMTVASAHLEKIKKAIIDTAYSEPGFAYGKISKAMETATDKLPAKFKALLEKKKAEKEAKENPDPDEVIAPIPAATDTEDEALSAMDKIVAMNFGKPENSPDGGDDDGLDD